jgi:hypothetical protein
MSFRVRWNAPRGSDWQKLVCVLGVCTLMSAGSAMAAVDAFHRRRHRRLVDVATRAIDVLSFSQGVSQVVNTAKSSGGQAAGRSTAAISRSLRYWTRRRSRCFRQPSPAR